MSQTVDDYIFQSPITPTPEQASRARTVSHRTAKRKRSVASPVATETWSETSNQSTLSGWARFWDEAVAAARSGDHALALVHFRREAEMRSAEGNHGRAAIAYRSAAVQAQRVPTQGTLREELMNAAGNAYYTVAHDDKLAEHVRNEALCAAAMCYLEIRKTDDALRCLDHVRRDVSAEAHAL